jgi:hypothetical protein
MSLIPVLRVCFTPVRSNPYLYSWGAFFNLSIHFVVDFMPTAIYFFKKFWGSPAEEIGASRTRQLDSYLCSRVSFVLPRVQIRLILLSAWNMGE